MNSLQKYVFVVATFTTIVFGACPDQWSHFRDKCFFLSKNNETFGDALVLCEAIGKQYGRSASLVTIEDEPTHNFLYRMMSKTSYTDAFIGLNDIVKEDEYVWVSNGRKATYFNWGPMQPNNRWGNENCGSISYDPAYNFNYTWGDALCSQEKNYFCEMVAADIGNVLG